jgi:hypothetical protein
LPLHKAIAGEKQTTWRRILVRPREAATRQSSLYGRVAATSRPDEKTSQVVCFLTEIASAFPRLFDAL